MTISMRLIISFTAIIAVCLGLTSVGYMAAWDNAQAIDELSEMNKKKVLLNQFEVSLVDLNLQLMDAIIDKDELSVDASIKAFVSDAKTEFPQLLSSLKEIPGGSSEFLAYIDEADSKTKTLLKAADELFLDIAAGRHADMGRYDDIIDGTIDDLRGRTETHLKEVTESFILTESRVHASSEGAQQILGVGFAGLLILGLLALFFASRSINRALQSQSEQLSDSTHSLGSSSETIYQMSRTLKETTSSQASAVQQTASAIQEISTMVDRTAESTKSSQKAFEEMNNQLDQSVALVQSIETGMDSITKSNETISGQVRSSNEEIRKIVDLINVIGERTAVINEIVFQTKLLSFNASVEAARAGQNGLGFQVVAQEIGNLAEMSGVAAAEISDILTKSVKQVEDIVVQSDARISSSIEMASSKVSEGSALTKRCLGAIQSVKTLSHSAYDMIKDVTSASNEQSSGIREINLAMQQLEQQTSTISTIATQLDGSAVKVLENSENLQEVTQEINRLSGLGASRTSASSSNRDVEPQRMSTDFNSDEFDSEEQRAA